MTPATSASATNPARIGLALGALGVVFVDVGTSPLYALNECSHHLPAVERTDSILGVRSLVFWVLTIQVVLKYMTFVTKADNRGEGGIFALLALSHVQGRPPGLRGLTIVVLVGAALLYGDGIITPAISVMGAVEGLVSYGTGLAGYVPFVSCLLLAALFLFQAKGTQVIGRVFGPTMLVWFVVLAGLGLTPIVRDPQVLRALNPWYGVQLLVNHPGNVVGLLGSLVLVITGVETLYADMGHFGRKAIVSAWYFVAFPALVLNYFGIGAVPGFLPCWCCHEHNCAYARGPDLPSAGARATCRGGNKASVTPGTPARPAMDGGRGPRGIEAAREPEGARRHDSLRPAVRQGAGRVGRNDPGAREKNWTLAAARRTALGNGRV